MFHVVELACPHSAFRTILLLLVILSNATPATNRPSAVPDRGQLNVDRKKTIPIATATPIRTSATISAVNRMAARRRDAISPINSANRTPFSAV